MTAVEIGVTRHNHALVKPPFVLIDFHDFSRKFMSRDAGIIKIGERASVRPQVAAADASIQHFQQGFPRFADRLGNLAEYDFARLFDVDSFHNSEDLLKNKRGTQERRTAAPARCLDAKDG